MEHITDYSDPRLDVYARLTEPQLRTKYEPDMGLFIAESPMVIERALDAGYVPESVLTCEEALAGHGRDVTGRIQKEYPEVPVYIGSDEALGPVRGYQLTRGVLCAMKRHALPDAESMLRNSRRVTLLYDVENPSNVGSIFRSAAAMFVDAVLLTPDCADPLYRRAARVSVGTVFSIPWTYAGSRDITDKTRDGGNDHKPAGSDGSGHYGNNDVIKLLRSNGFTTLAMALSDDSVSVSDKRLKEYDKIAIIMGNEGYGLPKQVIDECDHTVKIPMAHGVDSLNVAAASAVAFWELSK